MRDFAQRSENYLDLQCLDVLYMHLGKCIIAYSRKKILSYRK